MYARPVAGWKDQVKPEREQSLFWHWMWLEAWKPNFGYIFHIMKGTHTSITMRCNVE